MTIRTILKMGDPRLLDSSLPISDIPSTALDILIQDMLDTMNAHDGAGLAAPQIGIFKRVVVFGVKDNKRYPDTDQVPMTILINPEIEPITDELVDSWEGCLSIPGMRGLVSRYAKVRYRGVDQKGNEINREVDGFHAIVVQHECDHLDGILYPMKMQDMSYFGFEDEFMQASPEQQPTNVV
jgi:peptide deformylase